VKSNIGKTARLKDKTTIAQEESIPNIWNGTMFGDPDWPLNASRGFVSISWASCYPRDVVSAVYATVPWLAGLLAGCLSVTRRYCIKMAKPILNVFDHLVAHHSRFFWPLRWYPIPRRINAPLKGALNTWVWEKLAIFDGNSRLSWKRCETGRWLLWNVNRKSWVLDWMVSFSITLSDL